MILALSTFSITSLIQGLICIIAGESLRVWAVGYIGRESRISSHATAPKLCTRGPYELTRNPLYLANIAIYSGFAGLSNILSPWFPLLIIVFYGITYSFVVRYEEDVLQREWGEEFTLYARQVPRWIPTWRSLPANRQFSIKDAMKSEKWTLGAILAALGGIVVRWWAAP